MSKTGWKQIERDAAVLVGAKRFWANAGQRTDVESPWFAVQVKNPKVMALAELERLVDEMTLIGADEGKIPLVVVKRSAKRPTPLMVLMPAEAFKGLVDQLWVSDMPPLLVSEIAMSMKTLLKVRPGMRVQVAEYVAKSKARSRKTKAQEQRANRKDSARGKKPCRMP